MILRKFAAVSLALALALTASSFGGQVISASEETHKMYSVEDDFVPGEVIVALKKGYSLSSDGSELSKNDMKKLNLDSADIESTHIVTKSNNSIDDEEKEMENVILLNLKDKTKQGVLKAMKKLNKLAAVEVAEPNFIVKPLSSNLKIIPKDKEYYLQYNMDIIGAPYAWAKSAELETVNVGIIDSGISTNHEDLSDMLWQNPGEIAGNGINDDGYTYFSSSKRKTIETIDDINGWNFHHNSSNLYDLNTNGHGTHVAGIIGAAPNNTVGVAGVSWNAKLASMAAFMELAPLSGGYSGGEDFTTDNVINAVQYANDMGFKVTNHSYAIKGYSEVLETKMRQSPSLLIVAAGNEGANIENEPKYPASYCLDNMIIVAATDIVNDLWVQSNYGPNTVHLSAPGVDIYSTLPAKLDISTGLIKSHYGMMSGTSMAAPHVTGAAAMLMGANPSLTREQVKEIILSSVDVVPSLSGKTTTGGRLNVKKAMDKVKGAVILGDINEDGLIDLTDKSIVYDYILNKTPLTNKQLVAADVDGNGEVNLNDCTLINRYVLGIISSFPLGQAYVYVRGDINNDGRITQDDYDMMYSYERKLITFTPKQFVAADFDSDEFVGGIETRLLGQYLAGVIPYLPDNY